MPRCPKGRQPNPSRPVKTSRPGPSRKNNLRVTTQMPVDTLPTDWQPPPRNQRRGEPQRKRPSDRDRKLHHRRKLSSFSRSRSHIRNKFKDEHSVRRQGKGSFCTVPYRTQSTLCSISLRTLLTSVMKSTRWHLHNLMFVLVHLWTWKRIYFTKLLLKTLADFRPSWIPPLLNDKLSCFQALMNKTMGFTGHVCDREY